MDDDASDFSQEVIPSSECTCEKACEEKRKDVESGKDNQRAY
jgi:hypothetical protein